MAAMTKADDGTTKEKRRYRVTNWADHDRALVDRGNLTIWFDEASIAENWIPSPPVGRGKLFRLKPNSWGIASAPASSTDRWPGAMCGRPSINTFTCLGMPQSVRAGQIVPAA